MFSIGRRFKSLDCSFCLHDDPPPHPTKLDFKACLESNGAISCFAHPGDFHYCLVQDCLFVHIYGLFHSYPLYLGATAICLLRPAGLGWLPDYLFGLVVWSHYNSLKHERTLHLIFDDQTCSHYIVVSKHHMNWYLVLNFSSYGDCCMILYFFLQCGIMRKYTKDRSQNCKNGTGLLVVLGKSSARGIWH